MTANIDVIVFGGEENEAWQSLQQVGPQLKLVGTRSRTPAVGALNELIKQSHSIFLALVPASRKDISGTIDQLSKALQEDEHAQVGLPVHADDAESLFIWSAFPSWLSVLLQPVAPVPVILFRSASFERFGTFHEVDDPVWDWSIRTAHSSPQALVTCRSETASSTRSTKYPALAPAKPGPQRDWLLRHLQSAQPASVPLTAGLLQWHDYLDESHSYSQRIEGDPLGDHWHGIMHRREPDYSNAKYWYRRVGSSPIFPELARKADVILKSCADQNAKIELSRLGVPQDWDSLAFIDLCQKSARTPESPLYWAACEIQFWEMLLLLESSYQASSSPRD